MAKTVWILGAGFSRALGGPLLKDLFSERMQAEIKGKFGLEVNHNRDFARWFAIHFFRWGKGSWWEDAESYLDLLDSASFASRNDSPEAKRALIEGMNKTLQEARHIGSTGTIYQFLDNEGSFDEILLAGKKWMAAECCAFLKGNSTEGEKWLPYRRWAKMLTTDDTIVTFNYDSSSRRNGCLWRMIGSG